MLAALGTSLSSRKNEDLSFSRSCISELFLNETVTYHESQGTVKHSRTGMTHMLTFKPGESSVPLEAHILREIEEDGR